MTRGIVLTIIQNTERESGRGGTERERERERETSGMLLVLIHGRVDVTVGRWHFYIVDKDCSSAEILETDPQQQTYDVLITTLETDPEQQTYYDVLITTLEIDLRCINHDSISTAKQ